MLEPVSRSAELLDTTLSRRWCTRGIKCVRYSQGIGVFLRSITLDNLGALDSDEHVSRMTEGVQVCQ